MPKILLVEDDNNLREIFELRLQADGYQTLTAGDGEAALVIAMKEKPDLIIADVMMPKMSGFEMLETLRGAPEMANTKVIMMTALGQAEDQARGAKLGVVKYLVKSQVTLEDFARVVREVLGVPAPTEVSQANNNKAESEKPMDPSSAPSTPPADPSAGSNPISNPTPPMGDNHQSTADEQSAVNGQMAGAMGGDSTAPAGGDSSATPGAPADGGSTEHADVPVTPPPAGGSSDPGAPAAPAA